jgi:hypothetical protein
VQTYRTAYRNWQGRTTHDVDEDDLIVYGDIGSYVGGVEKNEHDDRQEL